MRISFVIVLLAIGTGTGFLIGRLGAPLVKSRASENSLAAHHVEKRTVPSSELKTDSEDGLNTPPAAEEVKPEIETRPLPEVERRRLDRVRRRLEREAREKERREARESPELHAARVAYEDVRAREETPALRRARQAYEQRVRFEEVLEEAHLGPNARRHRGNFKNQERKTKEMNPGN